MSLIKESYTFWKCYDVLLVALASHPAWQEQTIYAQLRGLLVVLCAASFWSRRILCASAVADHMSVCISSNTGTLRILGWATAALLSQTTKAEPCSVMSLQSPRLLILHTWYVLSVLSKNCNGQGVGKY